MGGITVVYTHVEKWIRAMTTVVRKRHSYTAHFKLTIVDFAEKTNNCAAQGKFGISKSS